MKYNKHTTDGLSTNSSAHSSQISFHPYNPSYCVSKEELESVLHLSQKDAAETLGVSRYQLRTAFNKVKISLRLKRWPMNRYDRTESSTVESGCLSPTITDASVSESCITNTTPLPSVKIEEDNHYIYHQQPEHYPEFDRKLLYSNAVKRGECPLSSFIPDIQFLPPHCEYAPIHLQTLLLLQ